MLIQIEVARSGTASQACSWITSRARCSSDGLDLTAAAAAFLSGASANPRNSPRFVMSDTAHVRSFSKTFFVIAPISFL